MRMTEFRVGSAQPRNETEMGKFLRLASRRDVEVLCFPEGFLHTEKSVAKLSNLCKEYGIWTVTGYDEIEEGVDYQSALILNDRGETAGKHRKTYLSNSEVRDGKTPGDKLEVFDTEFGKFGITICAEILCPEVTRVLALKGAEIVFHPIGVGMDNQIQYDRWKGMIQTRAIENHVYFVASTHNKASRRAKDGVSRPLGLIVNPAGEILAEATREDLIYVLVNPERREEDARKSHLYISYQNMISRRQPNLYSPIANH